MSIEKFIEDQISKAMAEGEFDNLPGKGQPIDLNAYFQTPESLRLCYSMLKNGDFAPSFHTINHIIYHTSLDAPELVPAEGQARATRAFASIIDKANKMTIPELKGPGWPYADDRGSVIGPF